MTLTRTKLLYIAAMLASGVVIGLFVAQRPDLQAGVIPPVIWPFIVSLPLDLAIGQAAARGKAEPLSMMDRFIGVFGAGLIVLAIMSA